MGGEHCRSSVPNSRLKQFATEIESGKVLLMVDVERGRIDLVRELMAAPTPRPVRVAWSPRYRPSLESSGEPELDFACRLT